MRPCLVTACGRIGARATRPGSGLQNVPCAALESGQMQLLQRQLMCSELPYLLRGTYLAGHHIGELGEIHGATRGLRLIGCAEAADDAFGQVDMSGWVLTELHHAKSAPTAPRHEQHSVYVTGGALDLHSPPGTTEYLQKQILPRHFEVLVMDSCICE